MRIVFFFLFLLVSCTSSTAQTVMPKKDSTKVYKDIENYSKKSGFGKFVYRLIFRSTRISKPSQRKLHKIAILKKKFDKHEGKIIRNIYIETLDPFGYSSDNDLDKPEKGFERFGNAVHLKTKNWTIRNILLFKKYDQLDSLKAKESERLIRRQRYVRSVVIKPVSVIGSTDSVDVSVRVLDSWSLIPTGSFSGSRSNIELTERNFFGLGHEFENNYGTRFDNGDNSYSARYRINNIQNTFISATANYSNDLNNNTVRSFVAERPFYSTYARWAAGATYRHQFYTDSLPDSSNVLALQTYKIKTKDIWAGHSFRIFSGKTEETKTVKLVTTLRYADIAYEEKPTLEFDPERFFNSEKLYLSSIGISSQKFQVDKYLFNFGIIEDVPYGYIFSFTGGFQNKNSSSRAYFGTKLSFGNYFSFGYLGTNIEYGTFINNGNNEEATFRIEANYFTNLLTAGNWKFRQFIKPSVVIGTNRNFVLRDRLSLEETNGIPGFPYNQRLLGTKRLLVAFQTQSYAPGNWHGFHFSPFFNLTIGSLSTSGSTTFNSKFYSQIGLGVLINNEYLVFNNFQLSFSFYPNIPENGTNVIKTNSFKNDDFEIPDYQIGQPIIVPYR